MSKTLVAYDCSGSTGGSYIYHEKTQNIVRTLIDNNEDFRIILWDNQWKEASIQALQQINNAKTGFGGTDVSRVADAILQLDFTGKLIIITDGQVSTRDIDRCDYLLEGQLRFTHVDVYLIETCGRPNMSVSCPFTRYCPHKVHTISYTEEDIEVINVSEADIKILDNIDSIDTLQTFCENKDSLLKALTARMMGNANVDTKIHDQLVRLRQRVFKNVMLSTQDGQTTKQLYDSLKTNEWEKSLDLYRTFVNEYYYNDFKAFDKDIFELLNITKGGLRNTFSHRLRRSDRTDVVLPQDIAETKEEEPDKIDYTCPITLDNENDVVLLIKENTPLIDDPRMTKKVLDDIFNCPLNALNYSFVCEALVRSFDMSISLQAYLQADAAGRPIGTSPFTRDNLSGVLYLGSNESQVAGTNMTISKMLTGHERKKIGNFNLWFAVIYFLLKDQERLLEIMPFVIKQMQWRMKNTRTFASMTGLSQYPNAHVPLELACWMVVVSPLLKLPTDKDVSRAHVFHLHHLLSLFKLSDLNLPETHLKQLERYANLIKILYIMLSRCKKQKQRLDMLMKALYQKCIYIETSKTSNLIQKGDYCNEPIQWIPIDGQASQEQVDKVLMELQLDGKPDELLGLYNLVDPSLSAENIPFPYDWTPTNIPTHAITWPSYGLSEQTTVGYIPICPQTCRPYYHVHHETWKDQAETVYHMKPEELISANADYIHFVNRYDRYPTTSEEFMTYLYYRYIVHRYKTSLPAPIVQFIREIFDSYAEITTTITPEEFKQRTTDSVFITKRTAMEQTSLSS
jgi:hypothetical protein